MTAPSEDLQAKSAIPLLESIKSPADLRLLNARDLQQVADTLGIARRTVDRDWRYARAFLAARANA